MKSEPKPLPSQEYLKQCFIYNPLTGLLYWRHRPISHFPDERTQKIWNTRFSGKLALTSKSKNGYLHGSLDNKSVFAHRIIYKLYYGLEPKFILHENGNKTDNRIEKLSNGTKRDNALDRKIYSNNESGFPGISYREDMNKWYVQIGVGEGVNKYLGSYSDFDEAVRVRKNAELEFGYHENHGKRT